MFYPPKGLCEAEPNGVHFDSFHFIVFEKGSGVQNWFVLTEKFQVLKICLRKIPKFASGNFFNVAILVRFCSRVLLDDSAVLNFAPEFSQTASPSEFCLRQVRYLAPPAPKSFNFTFSSLRLENLPPAWKFASGEVLSISPQFCTPDFSLLTRVGIYCAIATKKLKKYGFCA